MVCQNTLSTESLDYRRRSSSLNELTYSWKNDSQDDKGKLGHRHILVLMMTLCFMVFFSTRVSFTITLIEMVKGVTYKETDSSVCYATSNKTFLNSEDKSSPKSIREAGFDWGNEIQGHLLSSYSYGYIIGNVVGGPMCEYFGAKKVMAVALTLTGLSQLASPYASGTSPWLLFICQLVAGMSFLPYCANSVLMPRWIPLQERSRAGTVAVIGSNIGNLGGSYLTGMINSHLGWKYNFFINGALALLVAFLWCFVAYDSPHENPRVSQEELSYISNNIIHNEKNSVVKKLPPCWEMLKSIKVWALIVIFFCDVMGYTYFTSGIPMYLSKVHGYSTDQIGMIGAVAFSIASINAVAFATLADWLIVSDWLSVTHTRKFANHIGQIGAAVGFLALGFADCDYRLATIFVVLVISVQSTTMSGYYLYCMDISPNYAATIMGITGSLAFFSSVLTSEMLGNLITGNGTFEQWRIIHLTIASFMTFGTCFFGWFANSEVEPWNSQQSKIVNDVDESRP